MSSPAFAAKAFFEALSADVAEALAAHLELPALGRDARGVRAAEHTSVYARWRHLAEAQRNELAEELLTLANMASPHARGYLVRVAQKRWTSTRPDWLPFIIAWSTQDLAARMYLEDPHGFREAHRHYRVDKREQYARYRGQFVADVVPSVDRRERMKRAMHTHFHGLSPFAHAIVDRVSDESLVLFIHDRPLPLENIEGSQLEEVLGVCKVWLVFDFDSCELAIKAPSRSDREHLRTSFADIFVGVPDYFAAPECTDEALPVADVGPAFQAHALQQDRIERVTVQHVAVRPKHPDIRRITIEFADDLALDRAHHLLENYGVRLQSDVVEGAKLSFIFAGSARPRSVELKSSPDALKRCTARERSIHRYMKDWNLDADRRDPLVAAACSGCTD